MLFRLILLITAGVLLIGGAFLWINHINDETKIAEDNNSLPVKHAQKLPVNAGAPTAATTTGNATSETTTGAATSASSTGAATNGTAPHGSSTTVTTTTKTTNMLSESIAGVPKALGTNIAKIQDTIRNIPSQLMSTEQKGAAVDPSELTQAKLSLSSRSAYAMPAITREQAAPLARRSAGKEDPLAPIDGFKPFPSMGGLTASKSSDVSQSKDKTLHIPPPPEGTIPPPPPPILSGAQGDTLPLNELPTPPEKPSIAKHLKLVGILGDRAFMTVTDPYVRKANRLPRTLTVSPGDRVDYLSVIEVSPSSVTLEEDGQRLVKHLASLR